MNLFSIIQMSEFLKGLGMKICTTSVDLQLVKLLGILVTASFCAKSRSKIVELIYKPCNLLSVGWL